MFLYGIDLEDANEISPLYHLTMLSGPIAILAVVSAECLIPAQCTQHIEGTSILVRVSTTNGSWARSFVSWSNVHQCFVLV